MDSVVCTRVNFLLLSINTSMDPVPCSKGSEYSNVWISATLIFSRFQEKLITLRNHTLYRTFSSEGIFDLKRFQVRSWESRARKARSVWQGTSVIVLGRGLRSIHICGGGGVADILNRSSATDGPPPPK